MSPLIAARPLTYATRRLQAGDVFEAPERDARVLVAIRKAKRPDPVAAPADIPPAPPASVDDEAHHGDESDLDALRAEAEALGVEVDRRWKQARLAKEIAAAKPAED